MEAAVWFVEILLSGTEGPEGQVAARFPEKFRLGVSVAEFKNELWWWP